MHAFVNGHFSPLDAQNEPCSVLVEKGGRIVFTGDSLPDAYRRCPTTDLGGSTVVPAFADTHMHFASFALFNSTVDVRDAKDFADMGRILQAYADSHPGDKVIAAYGCSAHTVAEHRPVTRNDLDSMCSRPLIIVKYDGHAAVCNSALMNQLPRDVVEDSGCDHTSGWLYQNAFYQGVNYITGQVPIPKVLKSLIAASNALTEAGIGLVHTVEGVGYPKDMDVDMLRVCRWGLPQTMRIFFQTMDVEKVRKRRMSRIGGCFKLALDGCFGSEDAALTEGYANNSENHGFLAYTQEEVNAFCIAANRAGMQIAMHAIGDAAMEQAVTALETALRDTPREDHRHIIIHADLCSREHQARMAAMHVCVALQPAFLDWKQEPASYLENILGTERANAIEPLREMLDSGLLLSAGSDAPCTLPNPVESIHIACNHPNPAQSITPLEALRMHTVNACLTSFDEASRGTLEAGKRADFTVLKENPLAMPISRLRENRVLALYMAGKKVTPSTGGMLALLARAAWRKLFQTDE